MKTKLLAASAALALASCATTSDPATGIQTTKPDAAIVTSVLDIVRAVLAPVTPVAAEVSESEK